MKAYEILEEAALLATGSPPIPLIKKTGVGLINTVLCDLGLATVNALSDELPLAEPRDGTTAAKGIAALIALLIGDDSAAVGWRTLYEGSKSRAKRHISRVKNTAFGGGDFED